MFSRFLEWFDGPAWLEPWAPPQIPAAMADLLPWRAFDEASGLYVNVSSIGFVLEIPPFAGIEAETLEALSGALADAAPTNCAIQVIHWASPRFGAALAEWSQNRQRAGEAQAAMADSRVGMLKHAGWRPLHEGGPPFTLSDFRVLICATLAGGPGPANEAALSAFRRALEGTLASVGAAARRIGPDALLSLAAEWTAPNIKGAEDGGLLRPPRRWSPLDPIHRQCAAPGHALSVTPRELVFHHPDGEDIAARVLSVLAFPEVWPGWRGNALLGDFFRGFLQPGCPVLTCLTIFTGGGDAEERAFLKAARATQQAGTGIAKYLPGLPEKARDWQTVTTRLKEGERLVRVFMPSAPTPPKPPSRRPNPPCGPSTTARAGAWHPSALRNCPAGSPACPCCPPGDWIPISSGWAD